MPVLVQITIGSTILVGCALFQIWVLSVIISRLRSAPPLPVHGAGRRYFVRLAMIFFALLAAHTVHVYTWAIALVVIDALDGYEAPIYFALVSYTTLGYGDLTLTPDFRILGAFSAVTGILSFGLSTAFLVGYFTNAHKPWSDE